MELPLLFQAVSLPRHAGVWQRTPSRHVIPFTNATSCRPDCSIGRRFPYPPPCSRRTRRPFMQAPAFLAPVAVSLSCVGRPRVSWASGSIRQLGAARSRLGSVHWAQSDAPPPPRPRTSSSARDAAMAYEPPTIATLCDVPAAAAHADATAVVVEAAAGGTAKSLSHADLAATVGRLRSSLTAAGVRRGDVVSIVLPNGVDFLAIYLAVAQLGATAAPLNPAYTAEEFEFYLADAESKAVVAPAAAAGALPIHEAASKLGLSTWALTPTSDALEGVAAPSDAPADGGAAEDLARPDDIAMFLHTSGTTSRPKGVPLTQTNLATSLMNIARTYELTAADTVLLVMPLFHVHGLMAAALTTLATGGKVIIPAGGKFSASAFWPTATAHAITWYTAVPTIHQVLLSRAEADFPAPSPPPLRFIRSCSASLAPAVLERLETTFGAPVLEAYAMTEAAHQMTSNPLPVHGPRVPGSVGRGQNVEVAVLDAANELLPPGQVGEVCIRGANVTAGYKNNPEANSVAFGGGWFHTGDQGVLNADGYLTLTGRLKEMINRGGEKISPLEVDAALLAHPQVSEAVAFGVPDEKYGEVVAAAVVLLPGADGVTADDIKTFVRGKLASFKVPQTLFIAETLPRTATGKIQRRIVAQAFASPSAT
ncbi:hypothetical protein I4F81_011733 [Pyropia yezoensis]|uniref:Uncharacterized protein n=1 Tax=Pyropia yezoensis TaxID=2788 RepID=A0ACC3CG36_PYRYE|nr:hypothetical protein I4F81_011733 [Neopyropia yezoensis]